MVKWVEEEPAMANKDYTHFNYRGAKKVATMLYEHLNKGYEQYKVLRKNKTNAPADSVFPAENVVNNSTEDAQ